MPKMAASNRIITHSPDAAQGRKKSLLAALFVEPLWSRLQGQLWTRPRPEVKTLEDWRKEMAEGRIYALGKPGLYLDTGPMGIGKSYADIPVIRHLDRQGRACLTLVKTHAQCREVVSERQDQGVESMAYPKLGEETCMRYREADAALRRGLAFSLALCPECPFADDC